MKNKPAKKIFENTNYSIKKCDEKGCTEDGNFVAPKSPNSNEKYFFCLKHIKLYNKGGISLQVNLRLKFIIFKRMIFLKVNQHFLFLMV